MKTKSIWGNPPKRLYNLISIGEKKLKQGFLTCIVGCSDGKFLMPFARKGHYVVGYDIDQIALYGGRKDFPNRKNSPKYNYKKNFLSKDFELENKQVVGLKTRLDLENLNDFAQIKLLDFYRNTPTSKYDIVFTSCSLHYSVNKNYSLKEKVDKLKSIVNKNGYLYIDYMMALDEDDYENFPKAKFFRKGEIKNYFQDDWEILHLKENNKISFEPAHVDCVKDHFHRFGYILARRIK